MGGAGSDTFLFQQDGGLDTIADFNGANVTQGVDKDGTAGGSGFQDHVILQNVTGLTLEQLQDQGNLNVMY